MYKKQTKYLLVHRTRLNFLESSKFLNQKFTNKKWTRFYIKQFKQIKYIDFMQRSLKQFTYLKRKPRKRLFYKLFLYKFKLLKYFYGFLTIIKFKNYQRKFIKSFNRRFLMERFFSKLEQKLDVILYRIGFFKNTIESHDFIIKGLIFVNYTKIYNKNLFLKPFDIISITKTLKKKIYINLIENLDYYNLKEYFINIFFFYKNYLEVNYKLLECVLIIKPKIYNIIQTLPTNFKKLNYMKLYGHQ